MFLSGLEGMKVQSFALSKEALYPASLYRRGSTVICVVVGREPCDTAVNGSSARKFQFLQFFKILTLFSSETFKFVNATLLAK